MRVRTFSWKRLLRLVVDMLAFMVLLGSGSLLLRAEDWPMYRGDAGRTGYSPEPLAVEISLLWTYHAPHSPRPAWPRSKRLVFDHAYHPVISGGRLFYGSSADGKLYALDAATGEECWAFFTGGPVRFAPAAWKDRIFAVSDDGYLYCLSRKDGELIWKKRGGPRGRMMIGNGRMIARRPARGGPVVLNGIVYFAAGIWQNEGVYVHALDAETGKTVWINDSLGSLNRFYPHASRPIPLGVGSQGYLCAGNDLLVVPTGRDVPVVLNLKDGTYKYFWWPKRGGEKKQGGDRTSLMPPLLFNAGEFYLAENGDYLRVVEKEKGAKYFLSVCIQAAVSSPQWILIADGKNRIRALDRTAPIKQVKDRKGRNQNIPNVLWTTRPLGDVTIRELLIAGKQIFAAADNRIVRVDATTREADWEARVKGTIAGLGAAAGRLYVSTTDGAIHCFGAGSGASAVEVGTEPKAIPPEDKGLFSKAAGEILSKSAIAKGFAVDLGCGDGLLALELARKTELRILAIEADEKLVRRARRLLDAAGVYGTRVTVMQADPAKTDFPNYSANLVVSGRSVTEGLDVVNQEEARRLQRPFGGVICLGKPREMSTSVRGALEGAGRWTHQYADAGNSGGSTDVLIKAPLAMRWFGAPDLRIPDRDFRPPAPLFIDGMMVVVGEDRVTVLDAYNGHLLWTHSLSTTFSDWGDAANRGSNYCVSDDSVFIRIGSRCLGFDLRSGKEVSAFSTPQMNGKLGPWGILAFSNGLLFGSVANEKHTFLHTKKLPHVMPESTMLFALDPSTGKHVWTYAAEKSIRNNTVSVGSGLVFFIDRDPASPKKGEIHPTGTLVALDAKTGKVRRRNAENIYGTMLALSPKHDALLMCYQPRSGYYSERDRGLTVFRASNGERLWSDEKVRYTTRPIIIDRVIYALPRAWDLLTGAPISEERSGQMRARNFHRAGYGCGAVSGSSHLLLFRAGPICYIDISGNSGTSHYGGIRPGCWINVIPAGGLALVPEGTKECTCSYLNRSTVVLETRK